MGKGGEKDNLQIKENLKVDAESAVKNSANSSTSVSFK